MMSILIAKIPLNHCNAFYLSTVKHKTEQSLKGTFRYTKKITQKTQTLLKKNQETTVLKRIEGGWIALKLETGAILSERAVVNNKSVDEWRDKNFHKLQTTVRMIFSMRTKLDFYFLQTST